ncbi:DUF4189 domain-containing protein [Lysobacter sp. CA199]|uniref:DUF4189 domain-containing protein n=1 Tax=Lysobacter sp. CA199 TaxID=3455608 RepID=UPI003F8D3525
MLRWLPLLGLLVVGAAYADGCPDGTITNPIGAGGQPQCVPGANHQNWGGSGSSGGPKYARRWGAFAGDSASGKIGLAGGMPSKRKAERAAIAQCQSKGGANCKVEMAYYDQCGVMAYGGGYMNTDWPALTGPEVKLV